MEPGTTFTSRPDSHRKGVSWTRETRTTGCTAPHFPRKASRGRAPFTAPLISIGLEWCALEYSLRTMTGAAYKLFGPPQPPFLSGF